VKVNVEYRKLTPTHIPDLLQLWHDAGLTTRSEGREHPENLRREMRAFPHNYIGAFEADRLIGVVVATWDGRRGWVNRLAVHPEFRRRDLAQALIKAAESELERRGALVIGVLVEPENIPSLSLFRKAGFSDTPNALYLSKRKGPDV
jgi:ribosomal protein S18 acetylase RimI-like enzyme